MALARGRGWGVEGLDINPTSIKYARDKLGLKVTEALLGGVKERGVIDLVTFMQSVEYMTGQVDIMAKALELLKGGGLLGIDTPNLNLHRFHLVFNADEAEHGAKGLRIAPHVNSRIVYYTPRAAVSLLKRVGFKNVWVLPGAPRQIGGALSVLERDITYGLTSILYKASFGRIVLSPTMFVFGQK